MIVLLIIFYGCYYIATRTYFSYDYIVHYYSCEYIITEVCHLMFT